MKKNGRTEEKKDENKRKEGDLGRYLPDCGFAFLISELEFSP